MKRGTALLVVRLITRVARCLVLMPMLFTIATCTTLRAAEIRPNAREKTPINAFWKYQQGDIDSAQTNVFDDQSWQSIGLPHSFSLPYFMSQDFYTGYGWYRKHLELPNDITGKHLTLEFEGVFQEAEVFV